MRTFLRELQSWNGVAASQTANLSVPAKGPAYHSWVIEYKHDPGAAPGTLAPKATFVADVENIKVKLNGEPLIDISGQDLADLNDYYGVPMVDGYFPIMFARPEYLDAREELRFALTTGDVSQLTAELRLASGALSPQLKTWANLLPRSFENRPLGKVIRIRKTAQSSQAASGIREIHDLPVIGPRSDLGRGLKALHIRSGNIADHEILINGVVLTEATKELQDLVQDIMAFQTVSRNPITNTYHVDFSGNRYSGVVPTAGASDFRLKLNFSAAEAAFDVIHEEIVGQDGTP